VKIFVATLTATNMATLRNLDLTSLCRNLIGVNFDCCFEHRDSVLYQPHIMFQLCPFEYCLALRNPSSDSPLLTVYLVSVFTYFMKCERRDVPNLHFIIQFVRELNTQITLLDSLCTALRGAHV
jgi:hypothetical protein